MQGIYSYGCAGEGQTCGHGSCAETGYQGSFRLACQSRFGNPVGERGQHGIIHAGLYKPMDFESGNRV